MSFTCENVRDEFVKAGLSLNTHKGKIEEFTFNGETTKCNTCPPFTKGSPITISKNGFPKLSMKTCETNYSLLLWIVIGVCIILLIIAAVVAHAKHKKDLIRNSKLSTTNNGMDVHHTDGD